MDYFHDLKDMLVEYNPCYQISAQNIKSQHINQRLAVLIDVINTRKWLDNSNGLSEQDISSLFTRFVEYNDKIIPVQNISIEECVLYYYQIKYLGINRNGQIVYDIELKCK